MGKEPDPHACRPNSMDLNDAADMRDEAEQAFNDARKTRGKRDLLYVAVMACVIVMLTGAVCGRRDIIIASAVIAVARLPEHHGMPSSLENILTTIFTPDIVSGTRGSNEGNRRGKH